RTQIANILCWTSVIQPPMMETISGANVILPCNHTSITSGDYIYWYKNIPDQGLQSLIRGFKDTASDSRTLTFSKDRKSSELHIQNIRPEESGMYLCALQDTVVQLNALSVQ
uniref:Ig-like domain-containing protein n=1 Tax=Xenopus tropicalis TaxID=8364 RepID=A0A6I8R7A7_XENTR